MTEPSENPELLRCPFCGKEAVFYELVIDKNVECQNCNALISYRKDMGRHQNDCPIKAWNRRTDTELQKKYEKVLAFTHEIASCRWMQAVEMREARKLLKEIGEN